MDITGSILDETAPMSAGLMGTSLGDPFGSAAVDTILDVLFFLPNFLVRFIGGLGGDLGSTGF